MVSLLPLIYVALLGAILGSFINALSFRYNTGRTIMGRSRCMRCAKVLSPLDLIPIVSYVALWGRCRSCHTKISLQYPVVEATAALLSLLTYLAHPEPLLFLYWLAVWMILLFTVVYDIRHTVIPWACSLSLIALSLGGLVYVNHSSFDYLAGPLLAMPLLLLSLISHGRWMGWADGILELSLGWFLSVTAGITALMLAFWSGALVGILLLLLKSRYTMKSEMPFAPFLVLGAAAVHFFHVDFFASFPLL